MNWSLLEAIGHTPLVEIGRLNPNPRVRLLAKLEYLNPGGSIKDRASLAMIEAGEKSGTLTPDKTVLEATSGNTGIGLAMICAIKGYRLLLAMSESVSLERQKILRARGADILLTPGHLGTDGAIEEAYRLARENPDTYFMTDQFNNPANWQAHYDGTGPEIWHQTGGRVTHVVATLGTSGTLMGITRRLKEYNPAVRIVGVEPYLGHKIQGLKNLKESYCPGIFEKGLVDEIVNVDDEEAFAMARHLARQEGLFVGMSSGAAMAVACRQAATMAEGLVVAILPDSGERYLSTSLFTVREELGLRLFNTLGRQAERFAPLVPGKVSLYSCGPTADARMHLGVCRRVAFADLLCRYLEFRGLAVRHVMNITDMDDRTIEGSARTGQSLAEFTSGHIETFLRDLALLHIRPAAALPRTSEHLEEMVTLAEKLVQSGHAYEKLRSLYFNIGKAPGYGRLSGVNLDKIRLGATVDLEDYEKDNPRDFTLLKRCRLAELKRGLYVKTRWGSVRPSWHLQCAAMAMKYLGEHFDIHLSGRELIFPHHENEIAIATALTGSPLARFWVHCDGVRLEGKAADGGSAIGLDALTAEGWSDREIRFWLISTHYHKPVRYSLEQLAAARRALARLNATVLALQQVAPGASPFAETEQLVYDIRSGFIGAMDEDLNIAAALAVLFRCLRQVNRLLQQGSLDSPGAVRILDALRAIDTVLGVMDFSAAAPAADVQELLQRRADARRQRDWILADRLREKLLARGVTLRDEKSG